MTNHAAKPRTGLTVTQYHGPDLRFETALEYAAFLLSGDSDDPDFGVDLHELWDDPSYQTTGEALLDWAFERDGRF